MRGESGEIVHQAQAIAVTSPSVLTAFGRPDFYPHATSGIQHIQTHISHVFLTGGLVYKLKKPLNLGFLDFGSLAARRKYCLRELELNRRLAPEIYLQVLCVRAGAQGPELHPLDQADNGSGGEILEYCLQMREMDQSRMMDRLLAAGEVSWEDIRRIAGLLADFYGRAGRGPEIDQYGRLETVSANAEENFTQTNPLVGRIVARGRWRAVRDWSRAFLADNADLLRRRVDQGRILDGHGDLHAANLNLEPDGTVHIFDCIEFNERFRYQDAACDLAFLAMELDFHGRRDLARHLAERTADRCRDPEMLALMDFYKCYRAVVRAKVYGLMQRDPGIPGQERLTDLHRARAYFRLAARYAGGGPPFALVCFMGGMGAGKSYRAKWLSRLTGWPRLSSDQVRRELAGEKPAGARPDDYGQGAYSGSFTRRTYEALLAKARDELSQGGGAIIDASFQRDHWRRRARELALETGAEFRLVQVEAERAVVLERLRARVARGGAESEGREELLESQARDWEPLDAWEAENLALRVDGGVEPEQGLAPLLDWLRSREVPLTAE